MEYAIYLLQQQFLLLNATDSNLQLYIDDVQELVMHIRHFVEGFQEAKFLRDTSQVNLFNFLFCLVEAKVESKDN